MNQQIKKVSILILVALFLSIGFSYGITWSTGFEGEGALDGWIIKGNVATKDIEEIFANTNTWTIDSNENLMVALTPKESSGTYNDMVGDLSLSEESKSYITGLFSNITNVTYMYKDIILSEGEEFSVAWNYVATDYKPFNDSSLVTLVNLEDSSNPAIINGHYSEVCILGSTVEGTGNYTTGDYGSTGWQIVEFKAIEQGSYRIGFAVYNLADTINDPYLYLDDALGITKQNNEVFEPVERDENAPSPPGNFALLFTEDTLQEAEVNDGSISNSLQIELTVDAFTGSIGDFITDYEITGLPLGLTSSITKTEDKKAELTISGNANKHNEKDSIDNLVVSFKDEAFVGNNALAITNADNTVLNINYIDFENTITFPQPEAKTYGDEHFKLTATSDSNNKVQYSSSNRDVARVYANGTITIVGVGTTEITASDEGDNFYGPAQDVTRILAINQKPVTYSIINNTKTYSGSAQYATVTPSAISFKEDVDYKVIYSQDDVEVDEPIEAGVYDIYVETLNSNYVGCSEGAILTILKANQTYELEIGGLPKYIEYQDTFALYANGGNGEGSVTWSVTSGNQYAEITSGSGIVSINGIGSVTIQATKNSDVNYNDQTATVTFTTNKKQVNVVISNTEKTYDGYEQEVNIRATNLVYNSFEDIAYVHYFNQADELETIIKYPGSYNVLIELKDNYSDFYEITGDITALATINKADLIATADNKTIDYKKNAPEFTYNIIGFKGNDSINDLDGNMVFNCDYVKGMSSGVYEISLSGLVSDKYNVEYVSGKLTVLPPVSKEGSSRDNREDRQLEEEKLEEQEGILFTDVYESDWFYEVVSNANKLGLMEGTSLTTFSPNLETSRNMIVTILYRMEQQPGITTTNIFKDVAMGTWYYDAVAWCLENNIISGYDSETFGPENKITREQLAAILYRYATFKGYFVDGQVDLSKYYDAENISDWALEGMNWAVSQGIINGTTTNTLQPQGYATRAETAACLIRFIEKFIEQGV